MTEYVVENGELVELADSGPLKSGRSGRRPPKSELVAKPRCAFPVFVRVVPGVLNENQHFDIPVELINQGNIYLDVRPGETIDPEDPRNALFTPSGRELAEMVAQLTPGVELIRVTRYTLGVLVHQCFSSDEVRDQVLWCIWQVTGIDPEDADVTIMLIEATQPSDSMPTMSAESTDPQAGTNPEAGASA